MMLDVPGGVQLLEGGRVALQSPAAVGIGEVAQVTNDLFLDGLLQLEAGDVVGNA